jgi:hypothetical protein
LGPILVIGGVCLSGLSWQWKMQCWLGLVLYMVGLSGYPYFVIDQPLPSPESAEAFPVDRSHAGATGQSAKID